MSDRRACKAAYSFPQVAFYGCASVFDTKTNVFDASASVCYV
jgi:hypothetical protein